MRAQRLFPIALSLVLAILMTACKDSPTKPSTPANADALKGTWLLESIDGESFVDDGTVWTFGDGTSTLTDAETGCHQTFTYTATGTMISATMTANTCSNEPIGSHDEATWSVSNGKLTMKSGTTTSVMRRMTGNDQVIGTWIVTKIDGQAPAPGAGMKLYIYGSNFEILKLKAGETTPCLTRFAMQNTGSRLNVEVLGDECGDVAEGVTDAFSWSVSNGVLTLDLVSGGLKLEAVRQ
jgi:hypothetical protein